MKIREDFVTNSSSSSFVLGFKDEQELDEIFEKYREKLGEYFEELYLECQCNRAVSKEDILNEYAYYYDFMHEFYENMDTVEEIEEKLKNVNIIAWSSHGDGGEGEDGFLESFLYNFPATIVAFNNH